MKIFGSTMHPMGLTSGSHTSRSAASTRQLPISHRWQRQGLRVHAVLSTKPTINNLRDIQVLKDLKTDGALDSLELRDVQVGEVRAL